MAKRDHESRPNLWNVEDVAAFLRVRSKAVYRLVEAGDLPHLKIGRRVRFEPAAIERFIHCCRRGAMGIDTEVPSCRAPSEAEASGLREGLPGRVP